MHQIGVQKRIGEEGPQIGAETAGKRRRGGIGARSAPG